MDDCESGCPCKNFDCDLTWDETDPGDWIPVDGLESIGIMEPVGESNIF